MLFSRRMFRSFGTLHCHESNTQSSREPNPFELESDASSGLADVRPSAVILLNETLVESFCFLSRDDLDLVAYSSRRFCGLVNDHMRTASLRAINTVSIYLNRGQTTPVYHVEIKLRCPADDVSEEVAGAKENDAENDANSDCRWYVTRAFRREHNAVDYLLRRIKHSVVAGTLKIHDVELSYDLCRRIQAAGKLRSLIATLTHNDEV